MRLARFLVYGGFLENAVEEPCNDFQVCIIFGYPLLFDDCHDVLNPDISLEGPAGVEKDGIPWMAQEPEMSFDGRCICCFQLRQNLQERMQRAVQRKLNPARSMFARHFKEERDIFDRNQANGLAKRLCPVLNASIRRRIL